MNAIPKGKLNLIGGAEEKGDYLKPGEITLHQIRHLEILGQLLPARKSHNIACANDDEGMCIENVKGHILCEGNGYLLGERAFVANNKGIAREDSVDIKRLKSGKKKNTSTKKRKARLPSQEARAVGSHRLLSTALTVR